MKGTPSSKTTLVAALAGGLSAALLAGGLYFYGSEPHAEGAPQTALTAAPALAPAPPVVASVRGGLPDFRSLVTQFGPAVVNISVRATARPDDAPPFFHGIPMPQTPPHDSIPIGGEGSGFIVSPDGLILTNAHVVANAAKVTVKLTDRREFQAKVLGQDAKSDVAVLKIDAKNLPAVRLGDPAGVQVGEWVVAIGSPFGFENSVTAGIVSAKGRSLPYDTYVPFIQTDVAINPGNSGGPLFNLAGEVIGINSQIYSRSGGYQGVSFAIPIDVAMNVGRQLQVDGKVRRGRLGVGIQEVNQALAESFGLDAPRGALVSSVEPGGPAEKAGIEPGDVILEFNGRPIASASELPAAVAALKPGEQSDLVVWHEGSRKSFEIKVGEMQDAQAVAAADTEEEHGRLGLALRPLTSEERAETDLRAGLVVEDVEGTAAEAGIRPGDVVLSANGKAVSSVKALKEIVDDAHDHVALLVQRGDSRIFIPVELG